MVRKYGKISQGGNFAEGKSVEFWKDIGQAQNLKRALSSLGNSDLE